MKKSVKSRILAVFLACMAVVCMAVPAMAGPDCVQFNPKAGAYTLSNGDVVICNGMKVPHRDTVIYQGGTTRTKADHTKYNGTWYVDYAD